MWFIWNIYIYLFKLKKKLQYHLIHTENKRFCRCMRIDLHFVDIGLKLNDLVDN